MEMATEYAKERIQFDQPIGAFQAVKHWAGGRLRAISREYALKGKIALPTVIPFPLGPALSPQRGTEQGGWVSDAEYRFRTPAIGVVEAPIDVIQRLVPIGPLLEGQLGDFGSAGGG
jgi:hypothetical protein